MNKVMYFNRWLGRMQRVEEKGERERNTKMCLVVAVSFSFYQV